MHRDRQVGTTMGIIVAIDQITQRASHFEGAGDGISPVGALTAIGDNDLLDSARYKIAKSSIKIEALRNNLVGLSYARKDAEFVRRIYE